MATATVYIHGGDYDCSEAVRMCYRAADILPYGSYCWTGNEIELLTSHGFVQRSLSSPQRGDVLWREGHTEMYLGNNMQGGARIDEYGGITGPNRGDQTGGEIARSAYRQGSWTKLLRYEGGKTVNGIPAAEVAAQVMDHLIDHSAHGYSQPNRSGDGTIEAVKVSYGTSSAATTSTATKVIPFTFGYEFNKFTNVRDAPSTKTGKKVTHFDAGDQWTFDGVVIGNGYVWATHIGPRTKKRLYTAIATCDFGRVVK